MIFRQFFPVLVVAAVLTGCAATPQLKMSGGVSASLKAEAPIVYSVDYSKDGRRIASTDRYGSLQVWDLVQAKQRTYKNPNSNLLYNVAFSPDGKFLVAAGATGTTIASDNITQLIDPSGEKLIKQTTGTGTYPDNPVRPSLTPDGKFLLGMEGWRSSKISLWNLQNGKKVWDLDGYEGEISPDGRYVATCGDESSISLYDVISGNQIWSTPADYCNVSAFSPDSSKLLIVIDDNNNDSTDFRLYDTATGSLISEFGHHTASNQGHFSVRWMITALAFSPNGKSFISGDREGHFTLWDVSSGKIIRQLKTVDEVQNSMMDGTYPSVAFSPDGRLVVVDSFAATRLYDISTGNEVATLISFEDGEWIVTTPSGYYNSSAKGDQYYDVKVDGKPYSISQLRESFYRPDLVKLALAGDSLSGFKKIADIKQPPAINIVDTPSSVTTDQVTVSLQVKDQGGGIGDVRLYRNGTAVVLEKTRNLQVTSNTAGGQVLHYNVSLVPGKNTIRAIAFNGDDTMQSSDATIDVDAKIAARKPALYAVVVGIQSFENRRLDLSYSVADAKLFADTLEAHGKRLYSAIHVHEFITPQETTKDALIAALTQAQKDVKPEDLFVFYVASHGTVDDGQYLLITSNVGSTNFTKLKQEALSQEQLKDLISNIAASKKLVVLDTCDAGKMGNALQVALLTRGLSDDAAMSILSRAVGSTILSAATSDQEALEGYKGHGLFTYVVAHGLEGDADENHDGYVKTLELADYVDSTVPELAMDVFKYKQFPIVSPSGEGFPLAKVNP